MSITGVVTVSRLTFRFFSYNKIGQKICWQYEWWILIGQTGTSVELSLQPAFIWINGLSSYSRRWKLQSEALGQGRHSFKIKCYVLSKGSFANEKVIEQEIPRFKVEKSNVFWDI